MTKTSAGVLIYRERAAEWEIFLVHPGGPFWENRDFHAWSIPKGEVASGEPTLAAALRELQEETGIALVSVPWWLGMFRISSQKRLAVWALEGDFDAGGLQSNDFEMEWPPHSGIRRRFPEVDRAAWFPVSMARGKLHRGQVQLVDALLKALVPSTDSDGGGRPESGAP